MIPSLVQLPIASAKRKRHNGDEIDASTLLNILHQLPSLTDSVRRETLPLDWVLALSERQFDMLLSVRLYTGSLYRVLASVFVKDDIRLFQAYAKSTLEILEGMKGQDHPDEAMYFAVLNAKRRLPRQMKGLLIVEELGESNPMSEGEFRTLAARSLTGYTGEEGPLVFPSTLDRIMHRISGSGIHYNELINTETFKDNDSLSKDALKEFWNAMHFTGEALRSFILESNTVVGSESLAVYRGMKEEMNEWHVEGAFVSVTTDESVAREFTSNPTLEYENMEIGAPNQCCMMRITLLSGTPYLDIDTALQNSNGWGYALGEKELLLPPGLKWERVVDEDDGRVTDFPPEIMESVVEESDEEEDDEEEYGDRYYQVEYYVVSLKVKRGV